MNRQRYKDDAFQNETWSVDRVKELTMSRITKTHTGAKTRRPLSMVTVALLVVALTATTAFAAIMFMKPADAAREVRGEPLATAFESEDAITVNKTITSGDYDFSFLGMVSGAGLQGVDDNLDIGCTYAVVAITNKDGTPFTDETYYGAGLNFFVSPQIKGIAPWQGGSIVMNGGGYSEKIIDGVIYRVMSCDNVEIFADRGLYLVASSEIFYSNEAFDYNEKTGEIKAREDFDGSSVVFDLPIDKSKADPVKAALYLASLEEEPEPDEFDDLPPETFMITEQSEDGSLVIAKAVPDGVETNAVNGKTEITTDGGDGYLMVTD